MWASVFSAHALAFRAGSPLLALVPPAAYGYAEDTYEEAYDALAFGIAGLAAGVSEVPPLVLAPIEGVDPPVAVGRELPPLGSDQVWIMPAEDEVVPVG